MTKYSMNQLYWKDLRKKQRLSKSHKQSWSETGKETVYTAEMIATYAIFYLLLSCILFFSQQLNKASS